MYVSHCRFAHTPIYTPYRALWKDHRLEVSFLQLVLLPREIANFSSCFFLGCLYSHRLAVVVAMTVSTNTISEAEQILIRKLPTQERLKRAGVPEEVIVEHVAIDLATWTKGILGF